MKGKSARDLIIIGDALKILRAFPDGVIDCAITSPPYWGLRDYDLKPLIWNGDSGCKHVWGNEIVRQGQFCQSCNAWLGSLGLEPTIEMYVNHLVQIFGEIRRVLKDTGTIWVNMGDGYCANVGKGFKPDGGRQQGTLGNINPFKHPTKPKDLIGMPWRLAFALQADGWYFRNDNIYFKKNPMPESIQGSGWYRHRVKGGSGDLIDCPGCEKCGDNDGYVLRMNAGRCTKSHEYLFFLTKSSSYYCDMEAIREPHQDKLGTEQYSKNNRHGLSAKDYIWSGKTGDGRPSLLMNDHRYNPAGRNKRTVWPLATQPFPEAHFATFPEALVEPCIKAGTSERGNCAECGKPWVRVIEKGEKTNIGSTNLRPTITGEDYKHQKTQAAHRARDGVVPNWGYKNKTTGWKPSCECEAKIVKPIVLDPFMGSGTVALVAKKLGRDYLGIELSMEYLKIIRKRLFKQLGIKARAIDRR